MRQLSYFVCTASMLVAVCLVLMTGCKTTQTTARYANSQQANTDLKNFITQAKQSGHTFDEIQDVRLEYWKVVRKHTVNQFEPQYRPFYKDLYEIRTKQLDLAYNDILDLFENAPSKKIHTYFQGLFISDTDNKHPAYMTAMQYVRAKEKRTLDAIKERNRKYREIGLAGVIATSIVVMDKALKEQAAELRAKGICPNCRGRGSTSYTAIATCGGCSGSGCANCGYSGGRPGKTTYTKCRECGGSGRCIPTSE